MGTQYDNRFEGQTNGVNVSVSNSATSGQAMAALVINNVSTPSGAASVEYKTTAAFNGSIGVEMIPQSTGGYMRFDDAETSTKFNARGSFRFTGTTTTTERIIFFATSAAASIGYFGMTSAGKAEMYLGASVGQTGTVATAAFTSGAYYTVEAWVQYESTGGAADGVLGYDLYDSSGTAIHTNKTVTGLATGTTMVGNTRYYVPASTGGLTKVEWDDVRYNALSSGKIGSFSNALPVVSGSPTSQTLAGAVTATVTWTETDSDGTIASRSTAFVAPSTGSPTITGATTAGNTTFTTGTAPQVYAQQRTSIDNAGGSTTSASAYTYVPGSGTITTLPQAASSGAVSWTNVGGAANMGTALGDGSGTTLVESPDIISTESEAVFDLYPSTARTTPRFTLLGALLTASGSNVNKVRVYAGATLITERLTTTLKKVSDNTTSDVTTSSLDLYFDLTSGEKTAIDGVTDGWNKLKVGLVADLS